MADIIGALNARPLLEWRRNEGSGAPSWSDLHLQDVIRDRPVNGVTPVTPGWRFVSIGFENDAIDLGGGINPWLVTWLSLYRRIVVAHPQYPLQRHDLEMYQVAGTDPPVVFAAGEFLEWRLGVLPPARDAERHPPALSAGVQKRHCPPARGCSVAREADRHEARELPGWVWVEAGMPILFRSNEEASPTVKHDRVVRIERIEPATAERPALAIWSDAEGTYGVDVDRVRDKSMIVSIWNTHG